MAFMFSVALRGPVAGSRKVGDGGWSQWYAHTLGCGLATGTCVVTETGCRHTYMEGGQQDQQQELGPTVTHLQQQGP